MTDSDPDTVHLTGCVVCGDQPEGKMLGNYYCGLQHASEHVTEELEQLAEEWEDYPGKGQSDMAERINRKRYSKQLECAEELRELLQDYE